VKLVQANIYGGRLENPLMFFFSDQQPDIACFQEAISINGNGAIFKSIEGLQACWQKPTYLFHSAMFSFKFMTKEAHFGNAIISTLPFEKQETIFTNKAHKSGFDFDIDDYNVRNLQHVQVSLNGQSLHVLNHHGHHIPEHKNGDAGTLRQMKQITEYIKRLSGPIILTGDFNLTPDSKSLEQINNHLENLSIKYELRTTRTQLTRKIEVCDYIFVSKEIEVKSFTASNELVSDHKALVLEFDIN